MKSTKDFYNKIAHEMASEWYGNDTMLPCHRNFISRFPEKPRILDLCCGAGYESMRMRSLGAEVVGIDFSEESIKIARTKNPDIMFYIGDMLEDFSYAGVFDGVAVLAGLIHIPNEKLRRAFLNISQVLKDDGLLLAVVVDGTGKLEKKSFVTIDGEEYDREFYAHTKKELVDYTKGIFEFVDEIPSDSSAWKNYIFKKSDNI